MIIANFSRALKPINDQLRHDEGDRALRDMAGVLRASFRASDILARLGGDEFVARLPDADPSQIDLFVGRIESWRPPGATSSRVASTSSRPASVPPASTPATPNRSKSGPRGQYWSSDRELSPLSTCS
ncbi:MAG: diguanylate cyclase [Polyangiaceae bacterium]